MERGVERALARQGHESLLIDDRRVRRLLGRRLAQRWVLARAARFRADFVVLGKCLGLEVETVARVVEDRPSSLWFLDPPYWNVPERPDIAHVIAVGRLARTFHVSGYVAEWRAHGLNARFLPAAGDASIRPVPADGRYAADIAFIGRGYDETRAEFLIALAREFRVRTWGLGWEAWGERVGWGGRAVEGEEFARACSSARIVLGLNPALASSATTYASNRMWISILGGGFYMGAWTPGIESLLRDGEHCAWHRGLDDCITRSRYYLAHDAERERIRAAGERFVREHHTFDARTRWLLSGEDWVNPLA